MKSKLLKALGIATIAISLSQSAQAIDGVRQTSNGYEFSRHPLLIGDHVLEVSGGTIIGSEAKILRYREPKGPLVGLYCYEGPNNTCDVNGTFMSQEQYLESLGLLPFVRYSNWFQDREGHGVIAILGCRKGASLRSCKDYIE